MCAVLNKFVDYITGVQNPDIQITLIIQTKYPKRLPQEGQAIYK